MKIPISALILALLSFGAMAQTRIINGVVVPKGTFSEIVSAKANGGSCTATVVGPRALLAAAHCFKTGDSVEFSHGGHDYKGKAIRHPDYPGKDTDISVIIANEEIAKWCVEQKLPFLSRVHGRPGAEQEKLIHAIMHGS